MRIRFFIAPETNAPHIHNHAVDEDEVAEVHGNRGLAHYESQSDEEAVAEDEAAYEDPTQAMMEVPRELVPAVRELLAKRRA